MENVEMPTEGEIGFASRLLPPNQNRIPCGLSASSCNQQSTQSSCLCSVRTKAETLPQYLPTNEQNQRPAHHYIREKGAQDPKAPAQIQRAALSHFHALRKGTQTQQEESRGAVLGQPIRLA